jgi:predicted membrane protein
MKGKYIFAGMLIILGVGLILDQYHVWTFGEIISTWWPLAITAWGVSMLLNGRSSLWFGILVTFIGGIIQANKLDILPGNVWDYFWPFVLILIGVSILFSRKNYHNARIFKDDRTASSDDFLNVNAMFSGVNHRITSRNFKGGNVTVAFGGVEIDMTETNFASEVNLDLSVSFGGIEIWVPRDVKIELVGSPFLGGFENKTKQNFNENSPVLRIRYSVAFGGIELKN